MAPLSAQPTPAADLFPEAFSRPLSPVDGDATLPTPQYLEGVLMRQYRTGMAELREARGDVHKPEDTHEVIRTAEVIHGNLQALVDVLQRVQAECRETQRDEAGLAHGTDADGNPLKNMTVPFDGFTIRLTREFRSSFNTDNDQLHKGAAVLLAKQWADDGENPEADPIRFAQEVATFVAMDIRGKSDPKISGVKALATTLGHHGLDTAATAVKDSHVKRDSVFQRLKVEVQSPDQAATTAVFTRRKPAVSSTS